MVIYLPITPPGLNREMGRDRLSSLQALRGVAVLAVVAHHAVATISGWSALAIGTPSPRLNAIACLGASGVDLFFVISGFVMAHVAARHRNGGAARFLINRMIRIMPMFWLMSAFYIAWMLCTGTAFPLAAYLNTISIVPIAGTDQLPALYVGWTLAFELLFYLVAASVIAADTAQPAGWLMIAMALAATLGLSPRLHAIAPLVLNPIVGEFALGAAAWLVWRGGKRRVSPLTLILFGALMLFQTSIDPWTPDFSVHPALVESGATSVRRLALWGLPCALIVAGAALAEPSNGWAMRGFRRLGDASYSIYLSHPLAFEMLGYVVSQHGQPFSQALLGAALLTVALILGLSVHALIERPLSGTTRHAWGALNRVVDRHRPELAS